MPDIKREDLLSLHYQIEKSEVEQSKLEGLLNEKKTELKKNRIVNVLLKLLCSVLLISTIAFIIYVVFWLSDEEQTIAIQQHQEQPQNRKQQQQQVKKGIGAVPHRDIASFKSEIQSLKEELNKVKNDQADIEAIRDLYLYRKLIEKDIVYSVQIQSFTDRKIALLSKKYVNGRFYNDASYYKFSLGIFETLKEAQQFRKTLIRSGVIKKGIFIISYKDHKRLRIENPF